MDTNIINEWLCGQIKGSALEEETQHQKVHHIMRSTHQNTDTHHNTYIEHTNTDGIDTDTANIQHSISISILRLHTSPSPFVLAT